MDAAWAPACDLLFTSRTVPDPRFHHTALARGSSIPMAPIAAACHGFGVPPQPDPDPAGADRAVGSHIPTLLRCKAASDKPQLSQDTHTRLEAPPGKRKDPVGDPEDVSCTSGVLGHCASRSLHESMSRLYLK